MGTGGVVWGHRICGLVGLKGSVGCVLRVCGLVNVGSFGRQVLRRGSRHAPQRLHHDDRTYSKPICFKQLRAGQSFKPAARNAIVRGQRHRVIASGVVDVLLYLTGRSGWSGLCQSA
jgi:hypothetical protein